MTTIERTNSEIERDEPDVAVTFERPAELVDISERIYRRVFAVGMWLVAGYTAFAMLASLLQPASSQPRAFTVCAGLLSVTVAAALRPAGLYRRLRLHPWALLAVGATLGLTGLVTGPDNFHLFVPIVAVIGVAGIATPLRVVVASGLIASTGLGAPHLAGDGDLGGAIMVVVPPLVFWFIMDRIAGFALRLHHSLPSPAEAAPPPSATAAGVHGSGTDHAAREDRGEEPRTLSEPSAIEVDGIRLTSRQLQVVLLACERLRHGEIGACLGIGPQQVRRHLREARRRTGSQTTPQLVSWAHRTGLAPTRRVS